MHCGLPPGRVHRVEAAVTIAKRMQNTILPRVSIVIPSYNAAATIERTLGSLAQQDYPNLQVICVDGNSEDETVALIRKYGPLVAHLISEPDGGPANAINKGFRLADGDLFGWLGADDELAPGALRHFAEVFAAHPGADLVTGACRRIFADGSEVATQVRSDFQEVVSFFNGIEQPSTLWRSKLHRRAGELDETYQLAFDWEWWNRLNRIGASFVATNYVLSHYHFSDSNKTSVGGRSVVREMYRVVKEYGPYRGLTADLYYALYRVFDLRGFYDKPGDLPAWKKLVFFGALSALYRLFDSKVVNLYNWNFASKQERGLCWYK